MDSLDFSILLKIFSYVDNILVCESVCKKWRDVIRQNESTLYKNGCISREWYPSIHYGMENMGKEDLESINWKEEYRKCMNTRFKIKELMDQIAKYMNEKFPELNYKYSSDVRSFEDIESKILKARLPNDIKEFYRISNGYIYSDNINSHIHKYIPFSLNLPVQKFGYPMESDKEIFYEVVGEEYNPIIIGYPPDGEDYGESVWLDLNTGKMWYTILNIPEFKTVGTIVDYLKKSVTMLNEFKKDDD